MISNISNRRTSHSFTIEAKPVSYETVNTTLSSQGFGNEEKLDLCVGVKRIMQHTTSSNLPVNRKKRKTMMSVYPK
jgi:hypothetical protein